ncbi:MAG: 16S rRNA (guanine(966)-N(2))-methyltransferase RsmD [Candidatus Aminicenantes bacterium]|nr:16S rRNA (guanine(966)-N(2))-methyltransferase RsmD [Candidatus Aminicenantes bacterium]
MIRVIRGKYKGKKLRRVNSPEVRPMPDKLKESLFNMIHPSLEGAFMLDGFAGTGSVGIEALSRGADYVVFVDEYYSAVKTIKHNLDKCEAQDDARIVHKEFNRAVIMLAKEGYSFDLIFLDPPYKLLEKRNPLKVISKREILKEGGRIILRHHFKTDFKTIYFKLERKIRIGDDVLQFYTCA